MRRLGEPVEAPYSSRGDKLNFLVGVHLTSIQDISCCILISFKVSATISWRCSVSLSSSGVLIVRTPVHGPCLTRSPSSRLKCRMEHWLYVLFPIQHPAPTIDRSLSFVKRASKSGGNECVFSCSKQEGSAIRRLPKSVGSSRYNDVDSAAELSPNGTLACLPLACRWVEFDSEGPNFKLGINSPKSHARPRLCETQR